MSNFSYSGRPKVTITDGRSSYELDAEKVELRSNTNASVVNFGTMKYVAPPMYSNEYIITTTSHTGGIQQWLPMPPGKTCRHNYLKTEELLDGQLHIICDHCEAIVAIVQRKEISLVDTAAGILAMLISGTDSEGALQDYLEYQQVLEDRIYALEQLVTIKKMIDAIVCKNLALNADATEGGN